MDNGMTLHSVSELEDTINMTILRLISRFTKMLHSISEIFLELKKMTLKIICKFQKKIL